jgi:cytochrome b561
MTTQISKYSKLQVILHWGTLVLLLASFVSHEGIKAAWRTVSRGGEATVDFAGNVHIYVGLAVIALTAIRLIVRFVTGVPPEVEGQPPLQALIAKLAHWGLYALLFALPASGAIAWFGGVKDLGDVHEILFNLSLAVVGLHVVGALYHQFVVKDKLINRMM